MKALRKCLPAVLLVSAALFLGACEDDDIASGPETPFTYVAMGASDAVGYGAFPLTNGYVYLVCDGIASSCPGVTLVNCGILDARIGDLIDRELPRAIAADPDMVTIWTGINDLCADEEPAAFEADLRFLLRELRSRTRATVFVGDLVDLTKAPHFISEPSSHVSRERIADFNRRITRAAAEYGCTVVRLSEIEMVPAIFSSDGFHPNNDGYRELADHFLSEILPSL